MSLTSAVLAEKDCIFLVSIWEAYYTMSKPQACQRWLLCPFPPALSWRSDRGLCQKITSCPPSTFGLEYAIVTVSSESNGCIYHMAEILQCSIPRERSWVCGMSESSPTAMNQVGLCTQSNCCTEESKGLHPMSHLEQCFTEVPSWKGQGYNRDHQTEGSFWALLFFVYSFSFLLS